MKKFNSKIDPIDYFGNNSTWELFWHASNIHTDSCRFGTFPSPLLEDHCFDNSSRSLRNFEILRLSTMLEF